MPRESEETLPGHQCPVSSLRWSWRSGEQGNRVSPKSDQLFAAVDVGRREETPQLGACVCECVLTKPALGRSKGEAFGLSQNFAFTLFLFKL